MQTVLIVDIHAFDFEFDINASDPENEVVARVEKIRQLVASFGQQNAYALADGACFAENVLRIDRVSVNLTERLRNLDALNNLRIKVLGHSVEGDTRHKTRQICESLHPETLVCVYGDASGIKQKAFKIANHSKPFPEIEAPTSGDLLDPWEHKLINATQDTISLLPEVLQVLVQDALHDAMFVARDDAKIRLGYEMAREYLDPLV